MTGGDHSPNSRLVIGLYFYIGTFHQPGAPIVLTLNNNVAEGIPPLLFSGQKCTSNLSTAVYLAFCSDLALSCVPSTHRDDRKTSN
jgi:hypothetical protein